MSVNFLTLDHRQLEDPFMNETLTMSKKEREKSHYMRLLTIGGISIAVAAEELGLSERQCYRLLKTYKDKGDEGLIHGLRGCKSNAAYSYDQKQKVIALYQEKYGDYGPTLFSEKVEEVYGLTINRETLRQWWIKKGLWKQARKGRRHRKKRQRRSEIGALVQVDGSHHDWFEGRGPWCCLFVFIDDASNFSFMFFSKEEDSHNALKSLQLYIERHGIPAAIYVDRKSVYWAEDTVTDFARASATLGIKIIYSRSPQGKGRVERANRTHQDRLVKALREANVSDIEAANRFLMETYIEKHNARFSMTEELPDIHRSPNRYDLRNIICFETDRSVYNDMTIRIDNQFFQIKKTNQLLPVPRQRVIVRRWLDGSMHVFWREKEITIQLCAEDRCNKHPAKPITTDLHPWRQKPQIGRAKKKTISELCSTKSRKT
jgi:transposase